MLARYSRCATLAAALSTALVSFACGGAPTTADAVDLPTPGAAEGDAQRGLQHGGLDAEAALARLPREAGAYVAVRPADFDAALAPLLVHALRDREIGALFGEARSIAQLLTAMGLDAAQPILVSASAPPVGDGSELLRLLETDAPWENVEGRVASMLTIATTYRVVLPARAGADTLGALRRLFDRVDLETTTCPDDERCGVFGEEPPALITHRTPVLGAVFVRDGSVELEIARTRSWRADEARTWEVLARARKAKRGGPEAGRCAAVDLGAAAWLCVDADRFAAYGTAEGNLTVADALSGFGFEAGERAKIAAQGRDEIAKIGELATPRRRLVDGGSASLRFDGADYVLEGTWRTTDASRAGAERALAPVRCAPASEPMPWFDALRGAFPDPGPDFADQRAAHRRLDEAGMPGVGVAFARTWPNLLALGSGDLKELTRELGAREVCASAASGELRLTMRGRAKLGRER